MGKLECEYQMTQQQLEAEIVGGVAQRNPSAENKLYDYCADYFYSKHNSIIRADWDVLEEIFQNSFIKLWEIIENHKIRVEAGVIVGKDGKPLRGSIRSYFMGIAKLKYLEWCREHYPYSNLDERTRNLILANSFVEEDYMEMFYGDSDNIQYEIIADLLPQMSSRCYEILTKFYYEGKKLDRIMQEIDSIQSKDALKSKKHKCLEGIREVANETYRRYLKYN